MAMGPQKQQGPRHRGRVGLMAERLVVVISFVGWVGPGTPG